MLLYIQNYYNAVKPNIGTYKKGIIGRSVRQVHCIMREKNSSRQKYAFRHLRIEVNSVADLLLRLDWSSLK